MMRRSVLAALTFCFCPALSAWAQLPVLRADVYVNGLSSPVAFVQDPSDASNQFVIQQGGRIRLVRNGVLQATDFLNLTNQISTGGERGLLGLAFPPDYGTSGRLYVYFTNAGTGDIIIARFKRSANPLVADPATRFDLRWQGGNRFIPHSSAGNHNGGTLAFGPDGYLYAGIGDGGAGDDPSHNAQNPNTLLGKMLRINVNVPDGDLEGYVVPSDNPFLDSIPVAALPEIWAFGVRNPWKYSFDDLTRGGTGALVIADVGQGSREEIDYQPPGVGGRNYGWRNREGTLAHIANPPPAYLPLVDPIFDYDRSVGQSITGGYVYRGIAAMPDYVARYFFADYVQGRLWSLGLTINGANGEATASGLQEHTSDPAVVGTLGQISSFGVDAVGELYVLNYSEGRVLRLSQACPNLLSTSSAAYDASGGGGTVSVTTNPGCPWTAVSNDPGFLHVTGGASGNGSGTVTYTLDPNAGAPNPRSGTITIAGRTFAVNQTGCALAIGPTSTTFGSTAGTGVGNTTAASVCGATAFQGPPVPVGDSEHFGWNQRAPNATELAQYQYVLYIDDIAHVLSNVDCRRIFFLTRFTCAAALPSMLPGEHRLELATIAQTSIGPVESARSAALTVLVDSTQVTGAAQVIGALATDPVKTMVASDSTRFTVTTLATGLDSPSSLATVSDGRVFIAERSGNVRVWEDDHVLSIPALSLDDAAAGTDVGLLGITVHPDFVRNHLVFVAYTARNANGTFANLVVRYRELNNIFAEAAVILQDSIRQAPDRTPRIGFGTDRKLYVAFPSADTRASQDPASYAGKILRLNEDGSTPRDNPRSSPIIYDQGNSVAFGWQPASGQLWGIDRDWNGGDRLRWLESRSSVGYFDAGTDPTAASFYGGTAIRGFTGDFFVAALDGRHIQRLRFDPSDSTRIIASERLLDRQYGRISDIVSGPDGGLYFCTSNRTTAQPASIDDRLLVIRAISTEPLP